MALYRATGRSGEAAALAARRTEAFTPAQPRDAGFGEAIRLLGYTLSGPAVRAGHRLGLVSFWSARRPLDADLIVGVRVSDGIRRVWALVGPLGAAYTTTSWQPGAVVRHASEIAIPLDLPPGRYALRIRLWDSSRRQPPPQPRPTGEAGTGGPSDWLTLVEIEVLPPA